MGTQTQIELALNGRLEIFPGGYNIAWENSTGIYTEQQTWISAYNIPTLNEPAGVGQDAPNYIRGIYQLSVYCPKGRGVIEPKTIVDALVTHFKRGTKLVSSGGVRISIRKTVTAPALEDRGWYMTPISVYYHTFTENN